MNAPATDSNSSNLHSHACTNTQRLGLPLNFEKSFISHSILRFLFERHFFFLFSFKKRKKTNKQITKQLLMCGARFSLMWVLDEATIMSIIFFIVIAPWRIIISRSFLWSLIGIFFSVSFVLFVESRKKECFLCI